MAAPPQSVLVYGVGIPCQPPGRLVLRGVRTIPTSQHLLQFGEALLDFRLKRPQLFNDLFRRIERDFLVLCLLVTVQRKVVSRRLDFFLRYTKTLSRSRSLPFSLRALPPESQHIR